MKDQMQRAAVSIASNIAEGFDRQMQKEFIQFLFIARGSCAEVRTQLPIAAKVSILPSTEAKVLQEQTRKISAMLYNLIQYRKKFICLTLHPGRVGVHRVPLTLLPFTLYPTKNV